MIATTGVMDNEINAGSVYGHSFANLKHETRYTDVVYNIDLRSGDGYLNKVYQDGMAKLKALNVSGMAAGTTDKAIIPVYLDPQVIDISRKYTPAVELIPRVTNQGVTADWVTLTKGSAFTAIEDANLADVNDTYVRNSKSIKYLYAVGRVTGQTLAAVPSLMLMGITASGGTPTGSFGDQSAPNAMQLDVLSKTRAIKELEENLIFNGNSGSDSTQFDGIITLMGSTNTVAKGTSALTLADLNLAVQYAFDDGGRPNVAFCSTGVFTDIANLLQAKFGFLQPVQKLFWGTTGIVFMSMVGEIPIVPSMFLSNVSGSKAIYFLDLSVVEMRVLQDLTYERLAKTNDSDKYFLKIYETLIIKNTAFCSSVTAIS